MINSKHLIKVASAWVSIVYTICFVGVAIYPPSRELFMRFSLHADVSFKSDFLSFGYFVLGLVIWNIVTILAVWLFAALFNKIKK